MLEVLYPLSQHMLAHQRKDYERYFFSRHTLDHRLIILMGQRGVGKSTLMAQHLLNHYPIHSEKILYVPCDHIRVESYPIYDIAEAFVQHGGECICFDEIHQAPDWGRALKSIYDAFPSLRVLATGSSAISIKNMGADLSRRGLFYVLPGMSFREYLEMRHGVTIQPCDFNSIANNHVEITDEILNIAKKANLPILGVFKKYLKEGYYPYSEQFDNTAFYLTLQQNIQATLDSDLVAVHPMLNGVSIERMKRLLAFLAKSVPFSVNMTHLKKACDISDERTLKQYLRYLQDGSLLRLLYSPDKKLSHLSKPEKILFNNTNQLYALSALFNENTGTVRETFAASMLSVDHRLTTASRGDFWVDESCVIEIGGKNKDNSQVKDLSNYLIFKDDIEIGFGKFIPLWLLGLLY